MTDIVLSVDDCFINYGTAVENNFRTCEEALSRIASLHVNGIPIAKIDLDFDLSKAPRHVSPDTTPIVNYLIRNKVAVDVVNVHSIHPSAQARLIEPLIAAGYQVTRLSLPERPDDVPYVRWGIFAPQDAKANRHE